MPVNPQPLDFLKGPIVDSNGRPTREFLNWIIHRVEIPLAPVVTRDPSITKVGQIQSTATVKGRVEGIGTTVQQLTPTGQLANADQVAADGPTFGRIKNTALTANQVDLTKAGVLGPMGSAKLSQNVMFNYSNNATVDSIDNGTNATVRVYGPGGVGTTWHQFIGNQVSQEYPAFSGTTAYNQDTWVYFDGISFFITTTPSNTLTDGLRFCAKIHTVASGGGGGTGGGGGAGGNRQGALL